VFIYEFATFLVYSGIDIEIIELIAFLQLDESSKELMPSEQDDKFYASEKKSMSLPNVPLEGETNNKCKLLVFISKLTLFPVFLFFFTELQSVEKR